MVCKATLPNKYRIKLNCNSIQCSSVVRDMLIKSFSIDENTARSIMYDLDTSKESYIGNYYKDIAASRVFRLLKIANEEDMSIEAKIEKIDTVEEEEE